MKSGKILTTETGAPVADNQHSQTAGSGGPLLLQDHHLLEKLSRFAHERTPERVVHAKGAGAYGYFEVTADLTRWTKAGFLSARGKRTEVFARLSTVSREKGSADTVRDPRGFALKFYTEEGNYDLVGNNTPIFFIRDPMKFPDFVHSQKRDPRTNVPEPDNAWDFFSWSPEATHMFIWVFGDRGIPASLRHMDGFSSHAYQWMNARGEAFWVKYHFKTDQGIRCLDDQEAARLAGEDPDYCQRDLFASIERGEHPSWTLKMQIMPAADAAKYRINPFDITKVWRYRDYPLIEAGKLVLNRNPENYFAEVEQATFNPSHFVPGIGPSPDRILQARLFIYRDAQNHRLGINSDQIPVNRPRVAVSNYSRDGALRVDGNGGPAVNYEPNSFDGPRESGEPLWAPSEVHGIARSQPPEHHPEDDDFTQAGLLYRLMSEQERSRVINRIAASLSAVSRDDIVERAISHFRKADDALGARLTETVVKSRAGRPSQH